MKILSVQVLSDEVLEDPWNFPEICVGRRGCTSSAGLFLAVQDARVCGESVVMEDIIHFE